MRSAAKPNVVATHARRGLSRPLSASGSTQMWIIRRGKGVSLGHWAWSGAGPTSWRPRRGPASRSGAKSERASARTAAAGARGWGRHGTQRARGKEGGGVWRVAGRGGAEEAEGAGGPQWLKRHAGFGDARREGAGMGGRTASGPRAARGLSRRLSRPMASWERLN